MPTPIERLTTALADRYRIERELGQGGMATVYLAADLRHARTVALKVLRPELAAVIGAERFLQEITVTANLQHPHILQLYDSGEADGVLFYVMPYVEGESLRDKLNRERQLSLEETLDLTRAIASALDYAHKRGVIHRDIKPENILLVDDQPIVADFGIALAVSEAGSTRLTETGLSLGTPHYMSPEQATGDKHVDARSDVYALACMTFEMLVGEPPFTGPTAQAIIAKVITERPPSVTAYRSTVPPQVESAIQKALSKVPADRFATPHEFVEALGRAGHATPAAAAEGPTALELMVRRASVALRRPAVAWTAAAVHAVGFVTARLRRPTGPAGAEPVTRFTVRLPADQWLALLVPRVSDDGRTIVLPVRRGSANGLVMRRLDESGIRLVEEFPPRQGERPAVSPDGAWVVYSAEGKLWKRPLGGEGSPIELAEAAWGGADWASDAFIAYTRNYQSGLWRVSAEGGDATELSTPDSARGELGHWWPQVLPGGRYVLFTAFSTPIEQSRIEILDTRRGERRVLVDGAIFGRYVPTGHLLYVRGRTLLAAPFDLGKRAVEGQAVPVLDDLAVYPTDGLAGFDVSPNGTLVYVRSSVWEVGSQLVWVDRTGRETPVLDRVAQFEYPRLSPDGRFLALTLTEDSRDVWIYEFARGVFSRLTRHPAAAFHPVWTPDGRRVIYMAEAPQFDLFWRAADGSSPAETLLTTPNDKYPSGVTPDGRFLLYNENDPTPDLWMLSLDGSGERRRLTETPYSEGNAVVAPGGRWLAYDSNESGQSEVYVMAFPDGGRRIQASVDGGTAAMWTRGGRELVYRQDDRLLRVAFDPESGDVQRPVVITYGPYAHAFAGPNYVATPDGERFLMVKTPLDLMPREVEVVVHWFEELKARMGR